MRLSLLSVNLIYTVVLLDLSACLKILGNWGDKKYIGEGNIKIYSNFTGYYFISSLLLHILYLHICSTYYLPFYFCHFFTDPLIPNFKISFYSFMFTYYDWKYFLSILQEQTLSKQNLLATLLDHKQSRAKPFRNSVEISTNVWEIDTKQLIVDNKVGSRAYGDLYFLWLCALFCVFVLLFFFWFNFLVEYFILFP